MGENRIGMDRPIEDHGSLSENLYKHAALVAELSGA
jgi:hypothetical protein